jgi:hypothetical protein
MGKARQVCREADNVSTAAIIALVLAALTVAAAVYWPL